MSRVAYLFYKYTKELSFFKKNRENNFRTWKNMLKTLHRHNINFQWSQAPTNINKNMYIHVYSNKKKVWNGMVKKRKHVNYLCYEFIWMGRLVSEWPVLVGLYGNVRAYVKFNLFYLFWELVYFFFAYCLQAALMFYCLRA